MEAHSHYLKLHCRLCGSQYSDKKNLVPLKDFARDIINSLGIDISSDNHDIYPTKFCNKCRLKISRWKKNKSKSHSDNRSTFKTLNIQIYQFQPHGDGCAICSSVNVESLLNLCKELGFSTLLKDGKLFAAILDDELRVVLKRIVINSDDIVCYVLGNKLDLTFNNASEAIHYVKNLEICTGNFGFAYLSKKHANSPLKGKQGESVAKVESFYPVGLTLVDEPTIRNIRCKFFVSDPSVKTNLLCDVCNIYRSSLHAAESSCKQEKRKACKPTSLLTTKELKERVTVVQREKRNIAKINARLREKVSSVVEKESVEVNEVDQSIVDELVNKSSGEIEYNLSTLNQGLNQYCQLLWEQQVKASALKSKTQMRWHPALIRWAIAINTKSPSAYNTLRKSGFLQLPHPNTLYSYTHFTNPTTGINTDLLLKFYKDFNIPNLKEHEKNVSLVVDEMKVKSGLSFSRSTGKLVGFSEIGSLSEEMQSFEKRCTAESSEEPALASHVLLFMARGITSSMKFPVAYFATKDVTAAELYPMCMECIRTLKLLGLSVLTIVSDGAASNRKLYKVIGGTGVSELKPSYKSPGSLYEDKSPIYFICDPPHLMKTIRNNFENSNWNRKTRNLMLNGLKIQWTQLLNLYEWDVGLHRNTPGLRLVPKLKHEHLHLTPSLRMKVSLAAQVMSKTVANALEISKVPGLTSTVEFIRMVNKFFDCLNVSQKFQGQRTRNPDLLPYQSLEDPRFKWLTEEFLAFLNKWVLDAENVQGLDDAEKKKLYLSSATTSGCYITVNSFVEVAKKVLAMEGVEYLLSDKFNQDPVEEFFGRQRSAGGHDDNPTVEQFGHSFLRNVVAGSLAAGSSKGNVKLAEDSHESIDDAPLPKCKRTGEPSTSV